eukprot:Sspe_Gene.8696::Locus_2941_Transcript_1_1_Confidence_1.000_Length_4731::g.8696::m.8696
MMYPLYHPADCSLPSSAYHPNHIKDIRSSPLAMKCMKSNTNQYQHPPKYPRYMRYVCHVTSPVSTSSSSIRFLSSPSPCTLSTDEASDLHMLSFATALCVNTGSTTALAAIAAARVMVTSRRTGVWLSTLFWNSTRSSCSTVRSFGSAGGEKAVDMSSSKSSPPFIEKTRSALVMYCSWLVTSTRVLCLSIPVITLSNSFLPTYASTAERQSSRRYTSASVNTALASATRAFWPPLRLIPFSPISVRSPWGRLLRSSTSSVACTTLSYFPSGSFLRQRTFCFTVALNTQGLCGQYAIRPPSCSFGSFPPPHCVCSSHPAYPPAATTSRSPLCPPP